MRLYVSRFENNIAQWSKRGSSNKTKTKISFSPTRSISQKLKDGSDQLKITDKFLLSPEKANYAGLKPVFSNNTNMLNKNENHSGTTEHHLEFPFFIQTLPKSGLKNNMSEYKDILQTFRRTDNRLSKQARQQLVKEFNSKLSPLNLSTINKSEYSTLANRIFVKKIKKKSNFRRSLPLRRGEYYFFNI